MRVLDDAWGNLPEGTMTQADIGASGTVAYLSGPPVLPRELAWIARAARWTFCGFPARQYYGGIDLAPDGKRAVVTTLDAGPRDKSILDLEEGEKSRTGE